MALRGRHVRWLRAKLTDAGTATACCADRDIRSQPDIEQLSADLPARRKRLMQCMHARFPRQARRVTSVVIADRASDRFSIGAQVASDVWR